jgi:hypothetical protein
MIPLYILFIIFPQQSHDGKFPPFNPDFGCFVDGFEYHESAVSTRDEAVWVGVDGTGGRLEFAVEELVEVFWKRLGVR